MHWLQLGFAILLETVATSALKASEGFTRLAASLLCVLGYAASFWLLAQALKVVPVGVAYAIWSGAGVVLISLVGSIVFHQRLDLAAWIGIAMIVAGVVVLNLFSTVQAH